MDSQVAGEQVSKARGRKDRNSGQEAVIKLDAVKTKVSHLEKLYTAQVDATNAYSEAIKAVAEKSGLLANVVSKFIKAKVNDRVEDKRREATQLSLLFEDA